MAGFSVSKSQYAYLDSGDVDRCRPLLTLFDVETYFLSFIEGFVAIAINGRVVYEYILATFFRCDEAKTFGCVEPLNSTSTQVNALIKI